MIAIGFFMFVVGIIGVGISNYYTRQVRWWDIPFLIMYPVGAGLILAGVTRWLWLNAP